MAASRQDIRRRQPRRSRTDNGDALSFIRRTPGYFRLETSTWIYQATRHLADEVVVQAGLVASDAGVDGGGCSGLSLRDEIGIG